jgi:hypothetical protein
MSEVGEEVRRQRETLFSRLVTAYLDRDFVTIEEALRRDVVLHLPGYSPFAGEHHGRDAVGRFLLGLRQFLESQDEPTAFEHDENLMIASQEVTVHGPKHIVEMLVKVTVEFDETGRVAAVYVQPSDVGLLDHVIGVALLDNALGL